MPKRTREHEQFLLSELRDDGLAAEYLNTSLADPNEELFLVALRRVAEARRMAQVAKRAGVERESLYRMLSPSGNPRYNNLRGVLRALDLRLAVQAGPERSGRLARAKPRRRVAPAA